MPAATLLNFLGGSDFEEDPGGIVGVLDGEGVKGVEKGCAADVDVAAGGSEGRERA